ncbi:glycosyltransferase [Mycobacterium celatum]|uniref:Glycosyl transferase family 1 n=1 Tax=Mycobacterium celatum TaxID=28045 RepID=A0A1X1RTY5_MYCCE|nr:glycosyltransferase [Mycobacterium celatum]ORV16698.1 glycosyl transferase family 1 [Mycobacterium celatum]PIB79309.1 glycosyl transferase family 1 [Mycobacterium celatum]
MKFVLASWGSRGDVEPFAAVGRELLRRGHEVRMAVPPDLVGFVEAAGIAAVGYGPDLRGIADAHRDYWTCFFRNFWKIGELNRLRSAVWEPVAARWEEMSATLTSLADGADLLFSGLNFENAAANVAEYHDIPLATLHFFPLRANGQLLPFLPAPLGRCAITVFWWMSWLGTKKLEDAQRSKLGLPKTKGSAPRRITERGSLEIQAYDEVCFPGLAAEWARWNGQRPFVGALTIELPTDVDDEVASWIKAGTPPIFFGFGSIPVVSPAEKVAMISAACAQLGERALVCAGSSDFSRVPHFEHVKVVDTVNYASVFPACRAVVHHGAPGTTAAGLRAGLPTLSLPTDLDQTLWGAAIKRLEVGTARHFSTATLETLIDDLRTILAPQYAARARDIGSRMTKPAESVLTTADLVEKFARVGRVG